MQKIVPHLWFDTHAKEAAEFYTGLFPDSAITGVATIRDTPSGDCDIVSFDVWGYSLKAISAGPLFTFNPSISFMVNFDPSRDADAAKKLDRIWAGLSDAGKVLMPLDGYPFSKRYGWVQDRYGLTWQLILTDPKGEIRPRIIPSLMFVGDNHGKTMEATDFYLSVFRDSKRGTVSRYPAGMDPDLTGQVMFTDFTLLDQWFVAMDSGKQHAFSFNEAVSFIVSCDTQEEIDYYWGKLSAVSESEQCGWLKDRYGVSWQIVPKDMEAMMDSEDQERMDRVTRAFLPMKKLDIRTLRNAFENKS